MNYRAYSTTYPDREVIQGWLWDTVQYVSGTSVTLNFFNAVRATPDLGNMEIPSQLPANKAFLIRSIGFQYKTRPRVEARAATGNVTVGSSDSLNQLLNTGFFRMTIGSKPYCEYPLWMIPAGNGPFGQVGADGDTANPGIFCDFANNGIPHVMNKLTLIEPLFLPPQINFIVTLSWAAAITLSGGNTNLQVILEGDLIRPVQ